MSRLDLLVFGATGFTGKFVVREVAKLANEKGNLQWGIAGRNEANLKELLRTLSNKTGEDITKVPVILADVTDEKSLNDMASKTKVIVNCCGPYRFYGEPVIKACIANGTHHVDVSGEPQYMEKIQVEYNEAAAEKCVYIVSACGFDSIPADIGVLHFIDQFGGEVNAVETYVLMESTSTVKGAALHYGTWESAIYGLAHWNELRELRQKLFSKRLPNFKPRLQRRSVLFKSDIIDAWCLPFLGSDRAVVNRTQRFLYESENKRPVQMQAYFGFKSLFLTLAVALVAIVFGIMTKTNFTRNLLLKYPKIFSLGMVSHEGPTEEQLDNTTFMMTFYGEGWSERGATPEEHTTKPNKTMITRISGRNPGYGFTATALLLAGITILKESDKMPGKGGVFPPGAAFAKTSLQQELASHGLKFEVVSTKLEE